MCTLRHNIDGTLFAGYGLCEMAGCCGLETMWTLCWSHTCILRLQVNGIPMEVFAAVHHGRMYCVAIL